MKEGCEYQGGGNSDFSIWSKKKHDLSVPKCCSDLKMDYSVVDINNSPIPPDEAILEYDSN